MSNLIKYNADTTLDPYGQNTLQSHQGIFWEDSGFLLMYKRLETGAFHWPRSRNGAVNISEDQYQMLMQGLEVIAKHPISELSAPPKAM